MKRLRSILFKAACVTMFASSTLAEVEVDVKLHRYGRHQFGTQEQYEHLINAASQQVSVCLAEFGSSHTNTSAAMFTLAEVHKAWGNFEEAEATYWKVVSIDEENYPSNHPEIVGTLLQICRIYRQKTRYSEAESLLKRCAQMLDSNPLSDDLALAVCLSDLASVYRDQQKHEQAEPLYLRTIELMETTAPPLVQAVTMNNIGMRYFDMSRFPEALSHLEKAMTMMEREMGSDSPQLASVRENLAGLYFVARRTEKAKDTYERALPLACQTSHLGHAICWVAEQF